MVCARPLVVVMGSCIVLAACGGDAAWKVRPSVPQPSTPVIGGVAVITSGENLPDLTDAEVAYLVERAEKGTGGLRVRRIFHGRTHPDETRYVDLELDYHETHARIRSSRSVTILWDELDDSGVGRGAWSRETVRSLAVNAEICLPGRSFLAEAPVPEADVVRVLVSGDLTAAEIVEIVDAVYDHVPAEQQLSSIRREDDGAFEVMTIRTGKYRPHAGLVLEVRREGRGWKVTLAGEWVS